MASQQDISYIVLAVLALVSFVSLQIYGGYIMSQNEDFWNNTDINSTETDINPPPWAFSIWFLIYLWQFAWLIYILTTVCRQVDGKPVYQWLKVVSKTLFATYIVNQLLGLLFLLVTLYQPGNILYSMLSVLSLWVTVIVCLLIYHTNMAALKRCIARKLRADVICHIVLVQNGLAIYASWLTVADMLVINSFAVYHVGIPMETASLLTLTLLSVLVVMYFILDLTGWKKYTQYTLTTYPTVMWGLMSITIDRWDPNCPIAIYVLVLLLVVSVMFFAKIGITFGANRGDGKVKAYKNLENYY